LFHGSIHKLQLNTAKLYINQFKLPYKSIYRWILLNIIRKAKVQKCFLRIDVFISAIYKYIIFNSFYMLLNDK